MKRFIVAAAIWCIVVAPTPLSFAADGYSAQVEADASVGAGFFQDGDCEPELADTAPESQSSNDGGLGGDELVVVVQGGVEITRKMELRCEIEPPANPVTDANVGYVEDDATEDESAPAGLDPNCTEEFTPPPSADGTVYATVCVKWRICGGERLDDVVSGEIAGEESSGRYREYLNELTGSFNADGGNANLDPLDIDSINDILVSQGLIGRPSDNHLPVFYWCGERDEFFDLVGFDLSTTSFSWDLTYDDVYDIPGARNGLYIELLAQLDLYNPEIGLVPPAEKGFTFVQYPTWMFLQNEDGPSPIFTTNDIDTFRIDLRATLIGVEWHFGTAKVADCDIDQMTRYDAATMDASDDLPDCHHIFTQLGCNNLTATTRFKIEEKVRGRQSATLDAYPDVAWSDYLGTPTIIELTTTLDNYEIHPIVSLNAPLNMSRDEVIANARAAGTIPPATNTCSFLNQ